MDISDLTNEIAHGRTMVETATFLCRDEDEVRQKAKELGSRRRCAPKARHYVHRATYRRRAGYC